MCAPFKTVYAWFLDLFHTKNPDQELIKLLRVATIERDVIEAAEQAVVAAGINATREQYSERLNFLMMLKLNAHGEWGRWRRGLKRYRAEARKGRSVPLPPYPQKLVDVVMKRVVSQLRLEFPLHSQLPALIPLGGAGHVNRV